MKWITKWFDEGKKMPSKFYVMWFAETLKSILYGLGCIILVSALFASVIVSIFTFGIYMIFVFVGLGIIFLVAKNEYPLALVKFKEYQRKKQQVLDDLARTHG